MVRNNRRKAFTIVELVIVIAVIAILAAVMIPTFTGIIKRANISADEQLAASINTQLSIYKAEGNKIETEADLINALKSDADFTAQLNPKSAKHGYHYWYNAETQTVKLMANEDALETVQQQSLNAGGNGANVGFAHASPRSIVPGLYFLDQIGENENVIAEVFDTLAKMSTKTKADYQNAIAALNTLVSARKDDNKVLAQAVLDRLAKTAVMTDKGAFINTNGNSINYIYIPAVPEGTTDYYLNHTVQHASNNEVTTFTAEVTGGVIEIPEGVKVAEGSLAGFGAVTVRVDAENVGELANVFYAGAVHVNATVILNNGASYTVDGSLVINNSTQEVENVTLPCRNPVTGFVTGTSSDSKVVNTNIALDRIVNDIKGNANSLTLTAGQFGATHDDLPLYEGVIWSVNKAYKGENEISAENAKVTVTRDGAVKFEDGFVTIENEVVTNFVADKIVFTAKATAGGVTADYTLNIVTLSKITTQLNGVYVTLSKGEDGNWSITPAQQIVLGVATGDDNETIVSSANFSGKYSYAYSDISLADDEFAGLGVAPEITITAGGNYFTVSELACGFILGNVKNLKGGIGEETVTITVKDLTGVYSATFKVKVKDNTDVPYYISIPSYNVTEPLDIDLDGTADNIPYRYRVGNASPLPVSEIFSLKNGMTAGDYSVFIFSSEPYDGAYFNSGDLVGELKLGGEADALNFNDSKYIAANNQTYYLVIGVKEVDASGTLKVYAPDETNVVKITLINNGINVIGDAEFRTPEAGKSLVLHNDFTNTQNENTVVKLVGASIYGNYFTIKADQYKDPDRNTSNGYSFISVSGGTDANPSTINQLIINGPVYKTPAMSADNIGIGDSLSTNPHANFANGINVDGGYVIINDSYLYGFNSVVRINHGSSFVANGTTFEGGAWSNIFISKATKFQLNNCTTLQKRGGYTTTMGGSEKVLGMGIYVHDDMDTNPTKLTIELNNTKQYNWLSESDTNLGLFLSLAVQEIFNEDGVAADMGFYHDVSGTNYVNCTVASLGVKLQLIEVKWEGWTPVTSYKTLMEVKATQNFGVSVSGTYEYSGAQTLTETEIDILFGAARALVKGNVHSYGCGDDCDCANEIAAYGKDSEDKAAREAFLATKINKQQ